MEKIMMMLVKLTSRLDSDKFYLVQKFNFFLTVG